MPNDVVQIEAVQMTRALLKKLGGFYDIDASVSALFDEICTDRVSLEAGALLATEGGRYDHVYLIEEGWVTRSRSMMNGARQIVNVAVPGDFVALNALLFQVSDFELACKTGVTAFRFSAAELGEALSRHPSLSEAIFWVSCHEECMLAERIVSLGRRNARQRTAHVLCEFVARLEIIGLDDRERIVIPLSQDEFADILGISVVHVNKTLRSLQRDGVISFRNSLLQILDMGKLVREAGFDGSYLHFTRRDDRFAWRRG